MDSVQYKLLTILKQKVRSLKIESIRLQSDAFKMQHEHESMMDEIKLAKTSPTNDQDEIKADMYDKVC